MKIGIQVDWQNAVLNVRIGTKLRRYFAHWTGFAEYKGHKNNLTPRTAIKQSQSKDSGMNIDDFVWLPDIIEKLIVKHNITQDRSRTYSLTDLIPNSISKEAIAEALQYYKQNLSRSRKWKQRKQSLKNI